MHGRAQLKQIAAIEEPTAISPHHHASVAGHAATTACAGREGRFF